MPEGLFTLFLFACTQGRGHVSTKQESSLQPEEEPSLETESLAL